MDIKAPKESSELQSDRFMPDDEVKPTVVSRSIFLDRKFFFYFFDFFKWISQVLRSSFKRSFFRT